MDNPPGSTSISEGYEVAVDAHSSYIDAQVAAGILNGTSTRTYSVSTASGVSIKFVMTGVWSHNSNGAYLVEIFDL